MKYTYVIPEKIKKIAVDSKGEIKLDKAGNQVFEDIETCLEGKIVCNVPGYGKGTKLMQEIRFKFNSAGELVPLTKEEADAKVLEVIPQYVESVKAKSVDGAFEFENIEDLGATFQGKLVIANLASTLFQGINLSKK